MLGAQAGEVMTSVQMAMLGGLDFTALRDGIIAHPTLAEGLNLLFSNFPLWPVANRTHQFCATLSARQRS